MSRPSFRFQPWRALRLAAAAAIALTSVFLYGAGTRGQAAARYHNPVFTRDFPDPMVLRAGKHSYYAYGTTTNWEKGYFPILHSTDLIHWKYVADIFKNPPGWARNDLWAPDVIKRGKTYYAYYTGLGATSHCIGVATGSKPTGPFKQRSVIGCGDTSGQGYIDPDAFIDKDRKAYLYVSVDGPAHNISVIPLKSDLLHAAGARRELFGLTQAWEHGQNFSTVEGPFLIRHGNTYYLFFSGNDWNGNYAMGYATATSPTGPFTPYAGNPVLHGDAHVHGPGGGSVVEGPDGKLWMVYHAWPGVEGYGSGGIRNMRINPLVWKGSTVTVPVTP